MKWGHYLYHSKQEFTAHFSWRFKNSLSRCLYSNACDEDKKREDCIKPILKNHRFQTQLSFGVKYDVVEHLKVLLIVLVSN